MCSREILQKRFYMWLAQTYTDQALEEEGIESAAQNWVADQGGVVGGQNLDALSILLYCTQCGQRTRVGPGGDFTNTEDEPACLVSPKENVVPVYKFNQKY